jgi:hypothetical protein
MTEATQGRDSGTEPATFTRINGAGVLKRGQIRTFKAATDEPNRCVISGFGPAYGHLNRLTACCNAFVVGWSGEDRTLDDPESTTVAGSRAKHASRPRVRS